MTRLLDRMEKRGLITRERQTDDRRVVKTRITPQALSLLKTWTSRFTKFTSASSGICLPRA